MHFGFDLPHLRRTQQREIGHAVGDCLPVQRLQLRHLRRIGNDDLAATLMRNAAPFAKVVQHVSAAHAQLRFQAAGRVVNAGMNYA